MKAKTGIRKKGLLDKGILYAVLILIVLMCIYPIYYIVLASFSNPAALQGHKGFLIMPLTPLSLEAYRYVLSNRLVTTGYLNTIVIVSAGVSVNMVLTILAAYVLSIRDLMLHRVLTFFVIFTMYFSGGLIPGYLNVKSLQLLDTRWALILPGAINTYNLIILRTGFESLPDSLIESARLDGAGNFKILFRIIVPLTKASIAVMVLYYGVAHWNSWFPASIYLKSSSKFPLQLILRNILIESQTTGMTGGTDIGEMAQIANMVKYALIVVSTVPILLVYPFLQKYFEKGVMVGAVKG